MVFQSIWDGIMDRKFIISLSDTHTVLVWNRTVDMLMTYYYFRRKIPQNMHVTLVIYMFFFNFSFLLVFDFVVVANYIILVVLHQSFCWFFVNKRLFSNKIVIDLISFFKFFLTVKKLLVFLCYCIDRLNDILDRSVHKQSFFWIFFLMLLFSFHI